MISPMPLAAAARELGCSPRTLQRWVRAGAPVVHRGARGRGRVTLIDVPAVEAWKRSEPLLVIASQIPDLVAAAMFAAFVEVDGPHKRACAGPLAHGGYLAICAVLDRLRQDAPDVPELSCLPELLDRLRRIFQASGTVRL